MFKYIKAWFIISIVSLSYAQAEPLAYYFPEEPAYRSNIPTPESTLGFEVGSRHVRHDQLVNYFQQLARVSDNVLLKEIGTTNEHRKQVIATISSKTNLENLDQILADRANNKKQDSDAPAVVWLGYSIHGNEISGANASMLVAYYLAAAKTSQATELLDNLVIVIEPSLNPDGMDRFTTWVNTNRSKTLNTDPNHRSHRLQWPSGRTNHYMFDLNRDWLPLTQIESQNRMRNFHIYKPNVLADFHEMGKDGTYFFQPGVPSRTNPLTPAKNIELTKLFSTYHAKALDTDNRLYYSEESFDDFYYGKGSTYPDINGAIGILFEQASSRGYAQESINGVLTFGYGVKNQVMTSFSTLNAAFQNKAQLHKFRDDFYKENLKLADKEDFKGYLITENNDSRRLNSFLGLLKQHQINVYGLTKNYEDDDGYYPKESSYFVPLQQDQYRLIKTIFSKVTSFKNNTFYDVSGWTLPLAYNLQTQEIKSLRRLNIATAPWQPKSESTPTPTVTSYAYAFSWDHYLAPKMLNSILEQGVQARVATKSFKQMVGQKLITFNPGSIVIPAEIQTQTDWFEILTKVQQDLAIELTPLATGLTVEGINLGSPSLKPLKPVDILLLGGKGVSQYEAGHMLNYLDNQLSIAVTVVDLHRLDSIDFSRYSHVIMVNGEYSSISDRASKKLKTWLEQGGNIYAQKKAIQWLSSKELLEAEYISKNRINRLFDTNGISYAEKDALAAKKRIAGAIYNTQIDNTHPLTYGYKGETLPVFKNSTLIMEKPSKPFMMVAQFTDSPLLSGYSAEEIQETVGNNAAIIAHNVGKGRIVASSENLVFRGYWYGTSKIVANALFFSQTFSSK
ncbi:M14 family metallopeptidase [Thalassomonas sp. M1454]|uniref:M14 family metallopeptidase n=1 Tax=Thalassomonas sp. M1454 TaxID=2594477 RepID=UPI0039190556